MSSKGASEHIRYAPLRSNTQEWMVRAACRGIPMVDGHSIFFPKIAKSSGRPTGAHHDAPNAEFYEEALALCNRCPVISDCREEYTRDPIPKIGMYFGKTPSQRTRIKTRMHEEMLAKIRELVPYGVELEDCATEDAKRINEIHKALWGVDIPGYKATE